MYEAWRESSRNVSLECSPLSAVMEGMTGLLVLMGLFGLGAGMTYVGCYRFTGQDTPLVHMQKSARNAPQW